MKTGKDIMKLTEKHVVQNYGRFPIVLVRGKGTNVWDKDGKKYLDFVGGIAVNALGHCHPKVVEAIRRQAGKLTHVSNLYHIEPQSALAAELTRYSFAEKVFFCNSGTEANEAAIKLARRYFYDQGIKNKYEIITMLNSFHGRTMGALSATPKKLFHEGFKPLVPGFKHVPLNDIKKLRKAISSKTCAVMVEPIQGETGVHLADKAYMKQVRKLCTEKKVLLIFDEVQTGMGRTGTLFAYEQLGVKPDIMTLAKALGNGMPIGALAATNKVAKSLAPGTHGTTLGGNPLACSAALATLGVMTQKGFLGKAKKNGDYFLSQLKELEEKFSIVKEARGKGLILALELKKPAGDVVMDCLQQGILINLIKPNILRFLPPLIVTKKEIDRVIRTLSNCLKKLL